MTAAGKFVSRPSNRSLDRVQQLNVRLFVHSDQFLTLLHEVRGHLLVYLSQGLPVGADSRKGRLSHGHQQVFEVNFRVIALFFLLRLVLCLLTDGERKIVERFIPFVQSLLRPILFE